MNITCIRSGQESMVLVYSEEQSCFGSVFSNIASNYGIIIKFNPKDTKTTSMVLFECRY